MPKYMKQHLVTALLASAICVPMAFAQANSVTTQCADMWREAKAANKTGKQTWPEYLSKCSDKLAKAEAKAEPKAKESKATERKETRKEAKESRSYAGNPTPAQKAMYKRMRKCGEMWREAKAAGKEGNNTWPEYWDKCSDKLKK